MKIKIPRWLPAEFAKYLKTLDGKKSKLNVRQQRFATDEKMALVWNKLSKLKIDERTQLQIFQSGISALGLQLDLVRNYAGVSKASKNYYLKIARIAKDLTDLIGPDHYLLVPIKSPTADETLVKRSEIVEIEGQHFKKKYFSNIWPVIEREPQLRNIVMLLQLLERESHLAAAEFRSGGVLDMDIRHVATVWHSNQQPLRKLNDRKAPERVFIGWMSCEFLIYCKRPFDGIVADMASIVFESTWEADSVRKIRMPKKVLNRPRP